MSLSAATFTDFVWTIITVVTVGLANLTKEIYITDAVRVSLKKATTTEKLWASVLFMTFFVAVAALYGCLLVDTDTIRVSLL